MICPTCGHSNAANAAQCAACATPLPAKIQTGGTQNPVGSEPVYSPHLPKNTRLQNGNYAIGEVLGQGGFGITYKGGDLSLRRYVAIKEFFPQGCARQNATVHPAGNLSNADYEKIKAKFTEEARTLARFSDPGIVRVFGVFEENNTAYMVMEFLEGSTLSKRMAEQTMLDEAEAVGVAEKVGGALKVVHDAGIIHRDLKPDNICLTKDGRVVLIDFGTARAFASGKTVKQTTMLTPGYAPLEQYGQQARFGAYTDIYALAATLYHAVTGQVPPQATDRAAGVELRAPRELNPKLSPAFSDAIVWAMSVKAADRPQTTGAFISALKSKLQPNVTPLDGDFAAPVGAPSATPATSGGGWGSGAGATAAPVAAQEQWFHAATGRQIGPLSRAAMTNLVQTGIVNAKTPVWKQGTPDWMPAAQSEWAALIGSAPNRPVGEIDPRELQYTGFDRFMMSVPAWAWRTMWALILVLVVGRVSVGMLRYRNGGRDFGDSLAREFLRLDDGPIRSASLQLGEPDYDSETMTNRLDSYVGHLRYNDGDAGDLGLHVTERDWLYRPSNFKYSYEPTNFGPLMAREIESDLQAKIGSEYSVGDVSISRIARDHYKGVFQISPADSVKPCGGGDVDIRVSTFKTSDGSPAQWGYHADYSY